MASESLPVTQQIGRSAQDVLYEQLYHPDLERADCCQLKDRTGTSLLFGDLYRDKKAIIVFVRNFLCYTCKEYVEDLAKIPKSFLEEADIRLIVIGQASYVHIPHFCSLTGYPHEIYVDSEREIYSKLGMKRGETSATSARRSPHVKSSLISGSIKSIYRAVTSPAFDFQGDPAQQGGALIVGPARIPSFTPGNRAHFLHRDMNRLDHVPIRTLLQYAGVKTIKFGDEPEIIDV